MTRRRRKYVGGGGAGNPASLSNLRQGQTVAPVGNTRAMKHGFRSEALVKDVEAEVRELMDALAESAPVRDPDGGLPGADTVAIEAAARALKRWRSVSTWCDMHGRIDEKTGEVKQAARFELQGEAALQRALDSLGMSPMARSKLGLNIARTGAAFDLARQWADEDVVDGEAADA